MKTEYAPSSTAPALSERKPGQRLQGSGYSDQDAPVYADPAPGPGYDASGLRLDGPDFQKWVDDGNAASEYPPPSYADLRVVDPETGLRIDGPTYDEWMAAGRADTAYPPPGFADRRDVVGDFDDDGYLLDRTGQRVPNQPPLSEQQRESLQHQHDERADQTYADTDQEPDLRVDADGYELDPQGNRIPDRDPLTAAQQDLRRDEIKKINEARAWDRAGRAMRDGTTVDASYGAVDLPPARVARGIRPAQPRSTVERERTQSQPGRQAQQLQPIDAATGLRTDGPSYDDYVASGQDPNTYPPAGYIDQRLPAGQWPANIPADQRTPPPPASSVLSSNAQRGEAVDYGRAEDQSRGEQG